MGAAPRSSRHPPRCAPAADACLQPGLCSLSPWRAGRKAEQGSCFRLRLGAPSIGQTACCPAPRGPQRYFGTAVGKGRQGAKNEIEKLKLEEMSCREGIQAVAKM